MFFGCFLAMFLLGRSTSAASFFFKTLPICPGNFFINGTKLNPRSLKVRSEIECAQMCTRQAQCASYNVIFDSGSKSVRRMTCELLATMTILCEGLTSKSSSKYKYLVKSHSNYSLATETATPVLEENTTFMATAVTTIVATETSSTIKDEMTTAAGDTTRTNNNQDRCRHNWTMVLQTQQQPPLSSGSISDLRQALREGKPIALLLKVMSVDRTFVIPGSQIDVSPDDVCLTFSKFVLTSEWNLLGKKSDWLFGKFCASGVTDIFSQTRNYSQVLMFSTNWFYRTTTCPVMPSRCSGKEESMTNLNEGTIYEGDYSSLQNHVTKGHDLTVISHNLTTDEGREAKETWSSYSILMSPAIIIESNMDRIRAEKIWSFSKNQDTDPSLELSLFSTDGRDHQLEVFLNSSEKAKASFTSRTTVTKHSWLVDSCWDLVYSISSLGQSAGSHVDLVKAVREGHRVRVTVEENNQTLLAEADHVVLTSDDVVIAQILSNVATEMTFSPNYLWDWYFIHSSGDQCLYQVFISNLTLYSSKCSSESNTWFVDKVDRDVLLELDSTGTVVYGSKSDLRQSLTNMGELRLKVTGTKKNDPELYLTVESVEFGRYPEVSAISMRLLDTTFSSAGLMKPKSSNQGLIVLVTTEGTVQTGKWKFGSPVLDNKANFDKASTAVKWFVTT